MGPVTQNFLGFSLTASKEKIVAIHEAAVLTNILRKQRKLYSKFGLFVFTGRLKREAGFNVSFCLYL